MLKKTLAAIMALCIAFAAIPALAMETPSGPVTFGPFSAEDLNGEGTITEDFFKSSQITIVNFWATWCGPCIAELPDLAKIEEMTDGKVKVLGVLTDAIDMYTGERDDSAIEGMEKLLAEAEAEYPVLMPDTFLAALTSMLQYVPTSFIIDKDGKVLDVVVSSRSAEEWIAVAQEAADEAYETKVDLLSK